MAVRGLSIALSGLVALFSSAVLAQVVGPSAAVISDEPQQALGAQEAPDPSAQQRQAGQPLPYAPRILEARPPSQPLPTPLLGIAALPLPQQSELSAREPTVAQEATMTAPLEGFDTTLPAQSILEPSVDLVPQTVTTSTLSARDVASIGTLSLEQGGFGEALWQDTSYSALLEALDGADATVKSPTIQQTLRRLALSIAAMPSVSDRGAWTLVKARLNLLARSGALEGMHALAARLPNDLARDDVLKLKADVALRADDWPMACAAATEGLRRAVSRYWTSLRLACRAGQGNRSAVDLLLDTTDPSVMPPTQVRTMVNRLLEKTAPLTFAAPRQSADKSGSVASQTPLLAALSRLVDGGAGPMSDDALDVLSLEPLTVTSLAMSAEAPLAERWPAVAARAYWGHMDGPDMLGYAISAPVNTRADPSLGLAPGQLQRAMSAPNAAAMVGQLAALSGQGQFSGIPHVWTSAIGEAMAHIEPSEGLWPNAGVIAAHLSYAGYGPKAAQWYDDLRARAATTRVEEAQYIMEVWPWALAANAPGRVPFTSRLAELWLQTNGMDDKGSVLQKAKVVFAVLEGLGYDTGAALRVAVDSTLSPLPASLPKMDAAVARQQTGLAILAGFEALGPDGTLQPRPAQLRSVIANLRAIDQGALARRIAIEAMLHAGIARSNGA